MARQATRSKNKATPSIKTGLLSRLPAALDGLVIVALFLGLGYFFGFTPAARSYAVESLGFGLIPVSLWLIAVVVCLRYRPRTVLVHWRVWVGAAALAAISVGVLSLFHAREGTLFYASLGGEWGKVVVGQPLAVAVVKLGIPMHPAPTASLSSDNRLGLSEIPHPPGDRSAVDCRICAQRRVLYRLIFVEFIAVYRQRVRPCLAPSHRTGFRNALAQVSQPVRQRR